MNQNKLIEDIVSNKFIFHCQSEQWGKAVLIMEKTGKAFARAYWYDDDNASIYLDWLDVDSDIRNNGIGTELQEIREQIGRAIGATTAYLRVVSNSWMHDWYKRRGYEDYKNDNEEVNLIWMRKRLY